MRRGNNYSGARWPHSTGERRPRPATGDLGVSVMGGSNRPTEVHYDADGSAEQHEPILMRCPGSGYPGNDLGERLVDATGDDPNLEVRHCAYCNIGAVIFTASGVMPEHETTDVLAMLDQGDV